MIDSIKVGIFKFILSVGKQGLELPEYYGSTFRGAFGHAFKRIACIDTNCESCHKCEMETQCPYAYVFETTSLVEKEWMGSYDDIPRPFMFVPKLKDRTYYEAEEELEIEVRLFGKGIEYFPYFVLAFIQMGEQGLGFRRKKCHLTKVVSVNPSMRTEQLVYDGVGNKVYTPKNCLSGQSLLKQLPKEVHQVKVDFLTPLRLKEHGRLVETIEFSYLIRSLLRRISTLLLYHHGIRLELDFRRLIEISQNVKRIQDSSSWYEFERYSSRQGKKMKLGGVIGEVVYEGEIGEFLPLLELGRWVGAGKNNVFGLGQMEYVTYI